MTRDELAEKARDIAVNDDRYQYADFALSVLEEERRSHWCSQCGQWIWEPSCGPTHLARRLQLEIDCKAAAEEASRG